MLAPYAVPVIVTKHWLLASDVQLQRLVQSGAIINTSVSALDSDAHLAHRTGEIERYRGMGGASVARIVSCDFNTDHPAGKHRHGIQTTLFTNKPTIDNPLRVGADHPLVVGGLIRVRRVHDIGSKQCVSMPPQSTTYIGHCRDCPDRCGVFLLDWPDVRPPSPQYELFLGWRLAHA